MAKRLHNPPRFDAKLQACQYQAAYRMVNAFFNDEAKATLWMETQNPLLGNISPKAMLRLGRFAKLQTFIYTQLADNKV